MLKDLKKASFKTTFAEEAKKDKGNEDRFYDGEWEIISIDYRYEEVEMRKNGLCVFAKFNEINEIILIEENNKKEIEH